jgi:hypothetical protein
MGYNHSIVLIISYMGNDNDKYKYCIQTQWAAQWSQCDTLDIYFIEIYHDKDFPSNNSV